MQTLDPILWHMRACMINIYSALPVIWEATQSCLSLYGITYVSQLASLALSIVMIPKKEDRVVQFRG